MSRSGIEGVLPVWIHRQARVGGRRIYHSLARIDASGGLGPVRAPHWLTASGIPAGALEVVLGLARVELGHFILKRVVYGHPKVVSVFLPRVREG